MVFYRLKDENVVINIGNVSEVYINDDISLHEEVDLMVNMTTRKTFHINSARKPLNQFVIFNHIIY